MRCTNPVAGGDILVVEDDDSMRAAIGRLLGAAGLSSAAYPSAEALLDSDAGEDAACIVCDLKLPAMSGLDLLDALRARGWQPPLILITAYDAPGLREEALGRGVAEYLVKPFDGAALLAAIRSALATVGAS